MFAGFRTYIGYSWLFMLRLVTICCGFKVSSFNAEVVFITIIPLYKTSLLLTRRHDWNIEIWLSDLFPLYFYAHKISSYYLITETSFNSRIYRYSCKKEALYLRSDSKRLGDFLLIKDHPLPCEDSFLCTLFYRLDTFNAAWYLLWATADRQRVIVLYVLVGTT